MSNFSQMSHFLSIPILAIICLGSQISSAANEDARSHKLTCEKFLSGSEIAFHQAEIKKTAYAPELYAINNQHVQDHKTLQTAEIFGVDPSLVVRRRDSLGRLFRSLEHTDAVDKKMIEKAIAVSLVFKLKEGEIEKLYSEYKAGTSQAFGMGVHEKQIVELIELGLSYDKKPAEVVSAFVSFRQELAGVFREPGLTYEFSTAGLALSWQTKLSTSDIIARMRIFQNFWGSESQRIDLLKLSLLGGISSERLSDLSAKASQVGKFLYSDNEEDRFLILKLAAFTNSEPETIAKAIQEFSATVPLIFLKMIAPRLLKLSVQYGIHLSDVAKLFQEFEANGVQRPDVYVVLEQYLFSNFNRTASNPLNLRLHAGVLTPQASRDEGVRQIVFGSGR